MTEKDSQLKMSGTTESRLRLGRAWQSALLCLTAMVTTGCVSLPTIDELTRSPAPHLKPDAPAGIRDERSRFRTYFCAELEKHRNTANSPGGCEEWLHKLPDESEGKIPTAMERRRLQVLFVTGAFSECFGESARPFNAAIANLAETGDRFGTIVVGGRSGTEHNARQIAEFIADRPIEEELPLVLFGYSKGTADILQFLADYPALARDVSAVVSVAGSVGGSPLADHYEGLYDLLLSHLPSSHCEAGDHDVVHSLRTDVRNAWLAETRLPAHVRYYSLVAFTTRDRMARALVPSWEALLEVGRRNDGQLLPIDAMIPDSKLLAYLNADHWAVAMKLEDEHGFIASREFAAPFPQTALLGSILRHVGEDLACTDNTCMSVNPGVRSHGSAPDRRR